MIIVPLMHKLQHIFMHQQSFILKTDNLSIDLDDCELAKAWFYTEDLHQTKFLIHQIKQNS